MPRHWLIKSEPSAYSFERLLAERRTAWTGVRSFEGRNNLRAMKVGDLALYYHSTEGKAIVGIAKIASEPRLDETAPGEDWAAVDVAPVRALVRPISLAELKASTAFREFALLRRSRLSVAPVTAKEFERIVKLSSRLIETPKGRVKRR
jgi:predicted RNA-binding protein with PUA-like domain